MDETTRAIRTTYRTILVHLGVLLGLILVLGVLGGHLAGGLPGVWGALMAIGLAAFFMLTTVITMLVTAEKPLATATAGLAGGWLLKTLVLFGVLLAVRGRDFYHPGVFFVVLAAAIVGTTVVEMRAIARSRVPNVGTGGPDARL